MNLGGVKGRSAGACLPLRDRYYNPRIVLDAESRVERGNVVAIREAVAVQVAGAGGRVEQQIINESGDVTLGHQSVGVKVADDHPDLPALRRRCPAIKSAG